MGSYEITPDRLCLEAVEAYEHVNHPTVRQVEFIVDRIELSIEGHGFAT